MAAEWLTKLFDIGKLPSRIVALFATVAGILLFLPAGFADRLRLTSLAKDYGPWVGLVFITSIGLLSVNSLLWLVRKFKLWRQRRKWCLEVHQHIVGLDPEEQAVLREFMVESQNTIELPIGEASVAGLIQKGILESVGSLGRGSVWGPMFPVRLTETADKLLRNEHMSLPPGNGPLSPEAVEWAMARRPKYTHRRF